VTFAGGDTTGFYCFSLYLLHIQRLFISMSSPSVSPPAPVATSPVAPVTRAFFSGAVAGMVADSILHPLDTINLRMKVQTVQTAEYAGILRAAQTIVRNGAWLRKSRECCCIR
jgi:hypothetical protein